ncbi:hypothetical protein COH20_001137 [Aspergillus flavus]|uniref:Uncharacterized protein n=1 Tax=Aspergillus flavus TaxID=5059 RepID=A0AB74BXH4_ASPFL|nr:uncharacterized protein G4B84_004775 [Aspergillus flavus NRRL3357]KAJ1716940.1 hypothetical protein NYO67_1019 [Aspergillus flavus]QMW29440.1 hypothetical protein G4B84_004775 [Aspergillus flavus NRRL3357]RAQ70207.1 hypothetical protein COH21_007520 [Aspergillus flavus]RAQ70484.1 hypothetical protein COH20_001137 [Aspergillus flavus]RMZ39118.1 hypothetical protein CA14_003758 [Aspergillus flavus]
MVKLCLEDPPIFLKVVIIAISKGIVKVNVAAEWRTDWHRGLGGMVSGLGSFMDSFAGCQNANCWPATWPPPQVPLAVCDCRTRMRSFNRGLCAIGDLTAALPTPPAPRRRSRWSRDTSAASTEPQQQGVEEGMAVLTLGVL